MNYYNDNSPEACAWLRELIAANLIPNGYVDCRDIETVRDSDLVGYTQCHFFAGIGGWPYALQLAGWPEDQPVWTGSCPCQPFSIAGTCHGFQDKRHVWPAFKNLICKCRPSVIFGEQVASPLGRTWIAGVRSDLEEACYAVGIACLPAVGVGAKHVRKRFFFVANALCKGLEGLHEESRRINLQSASRDVSRHNWEATPRILTRTNGVSTKLDRPAFYRQQIIGYGNAIVPQVAAEFIQAFCEATKTINQ